MALPKTHEGAEPCRDRAEHEDPARLTSAFGLVTAGVAFATQKVITSIAGYFVVLRGKTFRVGDRIRRGGVRGDVIALGFIQTT